MSDLNLFLSRKTYRKNAYLDISRTTKFARTFQYRCSRSKNIVNHQQMLAAHPFSVFQ